MKKCSPSHGQNGHLLRWWVLVHSGQEVKAQDLRAGRAAVLHYRHHLSLTRCQQHQRLPLSPSTLGISISTTRLFSAYKRQAPYFFNQVCHNFYNLLSGFTLGQNQHLLSEQYQSHILTLCSDFATVIQILFSCVLIYSWVMLQKCCVVHMRMGFCTLFCIKCLWVAT